MNFLPLLEAKREGEPLSPSQIADIVRGVVDASIPEYQIAAWLMAIYFKGLSEDETRALTLSMRDSGDVLSWEDDGRPIVDKHSTGGVGDKVSLPLAPLLACLGFRVPMISGRGLGITGGTLDKLESIPGFQTRLEPARIKQVVQETGCCILGQTDNMVPADKKLYALRDVTATVPSIPLITASILSKKLAEGLDALVLDVKWGRAAFMQEREKAQQLADAMIALGNTCGTHTTALLNDMNVPLGHTAGNWLEVVESVDCLEGTGPDDLHALVIDCAAQLLLSVNKATSFEAGREVAEKCLASGAPRQKWDKMLLAQGADLTAFNAKLKSRDDAEILEVRAAQTGVIADVDARIIGEVVRDLGGGRLVQSADVDHRVGVSQMLPVGTSVSANEVLCLVHAATPSAAQDATEKLQAAWIFG